jgi:hypothetical protein
MEVRMASGDDRHYEVPRAMQRHMNKTRAAHSASAMAAMGVIKRLGLNPEEALRPHHDTPVHKRHKRRDGHRKKAH